MSHQFLTRFIHNTVRDRTVPPCIAYSTVPILFYFFQGTTTSTSHTIIMFCPRAIAPFMYFMTAWKLIPRPQLCFTVKTQRGFGDETERTAPGLRIRNWFDIFDAFVAFIVGVLV